MARGVYSVAAVCGLLAAVTALVGAQGSRGVARGRSARAPEAFLERGSPRLLPWTPARGLFTSKLSGKPKHIFTKITSLGGFSE